MLILKAQTDADSCIVLHPCYLIITINKAIRPISTVHWDGKNIL